MVSIDEAINLIINQEYKPKFEIVPIEDSMDRVCAQEIFACVILPSFNSSAMDGYAVKKENLGEDVEVIDTILAGDLSNMVLLMSKAIKIMTGAVVPNGTDVIVPQEDIIEISSNKIKLPKKVSKSNIREIGEDVRENEKLLEIGERINAFKIALLASQGITHIKVYQKPKITVFASGSELKLHFEKISKSEIFNSNTPELIARAKELGCIVQFIGKAKDDINSIKDLIYNSLDSDLIITSGGVSVGEADFTKEAFLECDFEEIFSKIDIKPGKPTTFGKIKETFILNLPGNPLACALNFEMFGTIIISKLSGSSKIYQNCICTRISKEFKHKRGKNSLMPGFYNGREFEVADKFAPGMVNVLNKGNGFILIDKDVEVLQKNQMVRFIPTSWSFRTMQRVDIYTKSKEEMPL